MRAIAALIVAGLTAVAAGAADPIPVGHPVAIHDRLVAGDRFMGIRLLGALQLDTVRVDGVSTAELSGLAFDPREGMLYAVGDEGTLLRFQPRFEGGELVGLDALGGARLRDRDGVPLTGRFADAEGLEWLADTRRLLVSFERVERLAEFDTGGAWRRARALPAAMVGFRGGNKGPEAVTLQAGHVVSAPEWPLRGVPDDVHRVYRDDGAVFTLPRRDPDAGAITALQGLPDGRLLAVERNYRAMLVPLIVRVYLFGPEPGSPVTLLAEMDNGRGWRIDNFEGLAALGDGRFLLVSDDNDSPLQRTLLLAFALDDTVPSDQSPK